MANADTQRLLTLVEEQTGYRVTVGTTDANSADAEMISAAADHPVHLINVSRRSLAVADYVVAVQCVMLLALWSHPLGVPQFQLNPAMFSVTAKKVAAWLGIAQLPVGGGGGSPKRWSRACFPSCDQRLLNC